MLIPIAASIGMFWLLRKKFVWWEYLTIFGVSTIFILVSKLIIVSSLTSDTEYWSESGVSIKHDGAYDEWIVAECPYDCWCTTDDDGFQTCSTCWEDCSHMNNYSDKYTLYSESGKGFGINESEYRRISKKWGGDKKTGMHPEAETYDKGVYKAYLPKGKRNLVECIVTSHSYENKVAVSNAEYEFLSVEVTEADVDKYGLHDYPEIYSGHKQHHILGPGGKNKKQGIQNMNVLNAELGHKKQVKAFILIYRSQPEEAGHMQESYWKGGNKNEFVMTIGIDDKNNVQWAYPFTWCENELLKTTTTNRIMHQGQLDLADFSKYLHSELNVNFERKKFKDFSHLTAEPTSRSITITMIILIIITVILVVIFALNGHDAKERKGGNIFSKFSKDNYDY